MLGSGRALRRWRGRACVGLLTLLVLGSDGRAAAVEAPETVAVPAGAFIQGSDRAERDAAYRLDEAAYGHSITRQNRWYEHEPPRRSVETAAFEITRTAITNRLYAAFVAATGHPAPDVDAETWAGYRLIHPYERTRRHAWRDGRPPAGREDHPVVLVSHGDAEAFAAWLSAETGRRWRLPTAVEWEKAARGPDGRRFPWGDDWDPGRLNSHDRGPFDTLPVGSFPSGASAYGLLDPAGQVFEWTASPSGEGRFLVKGGSWDDKGCGVCRPAAAHGRPAELKHILIGFRLIAE
jgi:formylglycine-generating enzyme required for sulfatase activity